MNKFDVSFSKSDIDFTLELFAFFGEGKGNTKQVIERLCEYFGVEGNPTNHKILSNKIRTFNPNRKDCKTHYKKRYRLKRKHNLTHRHESDGIYSRQLQRIYSRAVEVLLEKMTPSLAQKVIEAEYRFAIENKNLNFQERIERICLAAATGDSRFRDGETEPDSPKPQ